MARWAGGRLGQKARRESEAWAEPTKRPWFRLGGGHEGRHGDQVLRSFIQINLMPRPR